MATILARSTAGPLVRCGLCPQLNTGSSGVEKIQVIPYGLDGLKKRNRVKVLAMVLTSCNYVLCDTNVDVC